jgi:hypothetical protein
MEDKTQDLRQSIRIYKNDLVQKYFNFRINQTNSPYQVLFKPGEYKILFILSHMRSGSSLLTHLLISNPAIIGYGETHTQYSSEADFKRLIYQAYWQSQEFRKFDDLQNLKMSHQYILDKVLHGNKFLKEDFLTSENLYVIFLVREPERTIASMLDQKSHWREDDAVRYYNGRLAELERYSQIINSKERTLLLTHDQIINQSELVFQGLQNFLGTEVGFSEEYKILKTTGMRSIGDFKENIKSGRIVRKNRELNIVVSPEAIHSTNLKFTQCLGYLSKSCTTL